MRKSTWLIALLTTLALMFTGNLSANLILADGGASGSWFNLDRDGEGLFVEVVTNLADGSQSVSVAWYTYDDFGAQMWLSGSGPIDGTATSISVPVVVTSGPLFGPTYNKDDLMSESWGTIAIQFQTCDQGNMTYSSSIGYGTGSIPLTRLTNVTQVNCTEPLPEFDPVTPGKWVGPGVCLYVAEDGLSITSEGSTCSGGHAFKATVPGTVVGNNLDCNVSVICPDSYAIYPTDNVEPRAAFDCTDIVGTASGIFFVQEGGENDGQANVNGPVYDRSNGNGCLGLWLAVPED